MAVARLPDVYIPRPPDYDSSSSPLTGPVFDEMRIRALNEGHRQDRQQMLGLPVWQDPIRAARLLVSDVTKGTIIETGQRIAGGVRLRLVEETEYGIQHEEARQGDSPHNWDHERRLFDLVEHILVQPEISLSDPLLYIIPSLWILNHDGDQLDSETSEDPLRIKNAKHVHDYAAALQVRVLTERLVQEGRMTQDQARLLTGATSALILYHDTPQIQQRLLDAMEREGSKKPYEIIEAQVKQPDGTIVIERWRKYMTPEDLIRNLETAQTTKETVDLLSIPDWLLARMVRYKKSHNVNGEEINVFITPETAKTSFGLNPTYERNFRSELDDIAELPEDAIDGREGVYVRDDIAVAAERELVPDRLLTLRSRIDIAFLGDLLRTADFFDMAPPKLGFVRKVQVPLNKGRSFYRPTDRANIDRGVSKLPQNEDSFIRRSVYETMDILKQIRRRPGQKRPSLDKIKYVRDMALKLHEANIDMMCNLAEPFVRGNPHYIVEEEIGGKKVKRETSPIEEIVRDALIPELDKMVEKIQNNAATKHLSPQEVNLKITKAREDTEREIRTVMHAIQPTINMEILIISNRVTKRMVEIDINIPVEEREQIRLRIKKQVEDQRIQEIQDTCEHYLQQARSQHRIRYITGGRRSIPAQPYSTWQSSNGGDLTHVRTYIHHDRSRLAVLQQKIASHTPAPVAA